MFNSNEEIKKFCMKLVVCETQTEVIQVLKDYNLWDDVSLWRHYGDNENNWGTIGNQSARPDPALVEKKVNAIDALLMRECLKAGVNPESKEAPQSIYEAVERYFNVPNGKIANLEPRERTDLARNIYFVASGSKSSPSYSIIDRGEGQTPNRMPKTLLSIKESNKMKIPFVQGRFNQGSTGVFRFLGDNGLQLIISKRCPEIPESDDGSKDYWGFTIVRRQRPIGIMRNSVYTYLAPQGQILRFKADALPLIPKDGNNDSNLYFGTFVKLYEYQTSAKTNILNDLNYRINVLMPGVALPIRFVETRDYTGHSLGTNMNGLDIRLQEGEVIEDGFPDSSVLRVEGETLRVFIYAFKQKTKKDGKIVPGTENYTQNEGVIFTLNGQTHGIIPNSIFARKSVNKPYLQRDLLVVADLSAFSNSAVEDLIATSRDRLVDSEFRKNIETEIVNLLRDHEGLISLNDDRRNKLIKEKTNNNKLFNETMANLLKSSTDLNKLLTNGDIFKVAFTGSEGGKGKKRPKPRDNFQGKATPTFFKISGYSGEETYTQTKPKNVRFRIQFATDAANDYFKRDNGGEFKLVYYLSGFEVENYTMNLQNGVANLNIKFPQPCNIGDVHHYRFKVVDKKTGKVFENQFIINAGEDVQVKKPHKPKNKVGKTEQATYPPLISAFEDSWGIHGFDKNSVLKVNPNGDSYEFVINMDNAHYKTAIEKAKSQAESAKIELIYQYGMFIIGMGMLSQQKEENDIEGFENIAKFTKQLSPFFLPMMNSLIDSQIKLSQKDIFDEAV